MRLKIERCDEVSRTLDNVDSYRLDPHNNLVVLLTEAPSIRVLTVSHNSWVAVEEPADDVAQLSTRTLRQAGVHGSITTRGEEHVAACGGYCKWTRTEPDASTAFHELQNHLAERHLPYGEELVVAFR